MTEEQTKSLEKLISTQKDLAHDRIDYWQHFSSIDTWQFWVNVLILIVPLIVLYFKLDKTKAFHIGFYGFCTHVLSSYIDAWATNFGHWEYPYKAIPILPISFGLDTSLIPVTYMLCYQWTINHKKNYYLTLLVLAASFSFVFKPVLTAVGLFQLGEGQTYFHLFFWYLIGGLLSKWGTKVFLHFEERAKSH